MNIIKTKTCMDIPGILHGEGVEESAKYYKDAKSFYQSDAALADDTLMYNVYTYRKGDAKDGNLNWGMTVLYPVLVNGECNMTRGHWHENRDCAEFYYGAQGTGLLMLMDEHGDTWAEEVFPGSVHHIDGSLAHRLINTGEEAMKVVACWDCKAGHDYAAVEQQPFGYRVFKRDQIVEFEEEKNNAK